MGQTGLTTEEHVEIWRRYRTGESMRSISRALRPSLDQIRRVIAATGGRSPRRRSPSGRPSLPLPCHARRDQPLRLCHQKMSSARMSRGETLVLVMQPAQDRPTHDLALAPGR